MTTSKSPTRPARRDALFFGSGALGSAAVGPDSKVRGDIGNASGTPASDTSSINVFPELVLGEPDRPSRPRRRVVLAIVLSLAAHGLVGQIMAFGSLVSTLFWVPVESGRASIELQASIAARESAEPDIEPLLDQLLEKPLDVPIATELTPQVPESRPVADHAVVLPELPFTPFGRKEAAAAPEPIQTQPRELLAMAVPPETSAADKPRPMRRRKMARPRLSETLPSEASTASPASQASQGDETQPPALVSNPSPAYPADALAQGWTGRVLIWLELAEDGTVAAARVHETSGHDSLDRAALEAVRRWRFAPLDPQSPTTRQFAAPITFRLATD